MNIGLRELMRIDHRRRASAETAYHPPRQPPLACLPHRDATHFSYAEPIRASPDQIVVFVGPTISTPEASALLPARYLPPARCGDILLAHRLRPAVIAIIDGVFEHEAAVWHKEILLTLDKGIQVVGASSMGALRAAELGPFGMVGIGAIFENYLEGVYTDDDEVAVLYRRFRETYEVASDAMVNIRETVKSAVQAEVIDTKLARLLLRQAKNTFYGDRDIRALLEERTYPVAYRQELKAMRLFLAQGGYVDQKKADACALLATLATTGCASHGTRSRETTNHSIFVCKLIHDAACRAFGETQGWFPVAERVATCAAICQPLFAVVQRFASLLAVCHRLAVSDQHHLVGRTALGDSYLSEFGMGTGTSPRSWALENDLSGADYVALQGRVVAVWRWLRRVERSVPDCEARSAEYTAHFCRIYGYYRQRGSSRSPRGPHGIGRIGAPDLCNLDFLLAMMGRLWSALDHVAATSGLAPSQARIQRFSDEFRKSRGLRTAREAKAWMAAHDLTLTSYTELLTAYDRLSFLCDGFNLRALGIADPEEQDICWLHDALRLSGMYTAIKLTMNQGMP